MVMKRYLLADIFRIIKTGKSRPMKLIDLKFFPIKLIDVKFFPMKLIDLNFFPMKLIDLKLFKEILS